MPASYDRPPVTNAGELAATSRLFFAVLFLASSQLRVRVQYTHNADIYAYTLFI